MCLASAQLPAWQLPPIRIAYASEAAVHRNETRKPPKDESNVVRRSFEKETQDGQHENDPNPHHAERRRSILGAPVDPNSPTTASNFPPGVAVEDATDPGRATPGAAPVDNRSGASGAPASARKKPE